MLFFAFAGYARIATLGEEVVDPRRTIPRAIPLALGIALVVYAAVAVSALAAVGAAELARTPAPLLLVVEGGRWAALSPAVRIGATVASLGVLLSLLAGVSRTAFAMAGDGDLPRFLASVHPRHRIPDRAELLVGAIVIAIVILADVRDAIGFSSFAVLTYYAIANASALTLRAQDGAGLVCLPQAVLSAADCSHSACRRNRSLAARRCWSPARRCTLCDGVRLCSGRPGSHDAGRNAGLKRRQRMDPDRTRVAALSSSRLLQADAATGTFNRRRYPIPSARLAS